jgi:hypothetical protein
LPTLLALVSLEMDRSDQRGDGGLINDILVLLERYQTPADLGDVGEGPEVDAIPSLRPSNKSAGSLARNETWPERRSFMI